MLIAANTAIAKQDPAANAKDKAVIGWLEVVNKSEIDVANLAKTKELTSDVTEFADFMINQHSDNLKKTQEISKNEKIKANKDGATVALEKKMKKELKKLEKMAGKSFEKEYVNLMVKGHEGVLKDLDDKYVRQVQNEKVKDHLEDTRKHVEDHLEKAKELKEKLHD